MCGIAGFSGAGTKEELEEALKGISHRGPDDSGIFFDRGVGLAHARLSIIDLSPAGHQPMFNKDNTLAVVFNGEIYNFQTLKKELEGKGCVFKSSSDTEVILFLYEIYGEKLFEKLVGMFAIALYDFKLKKLILARDRMGEKPLYWSQGGGRLVFASELGALMSSGLVKKEIDPVSLGKYLLLDYVPTPATILTGVYKLEPATCLVYENNTVRKEAFWSPEHDVLNITEAEAVSRLDALLKESVSGELISDAPLGVFLSGGIDSSAIAWYAQNNSKEKINTFSIGFDDPSFDESRYAREAARSIGTNHHEKRVSAKDALSLIKEIPDVFSEPVADASVIPTMLLSVFTRKGVKVSLGGDGGDELFAGYPTFQAEVIFKIYERLPGIFKRIFEKAVQALPAQDTNFNWSFKLRKFISSHNEDTFRRHAEWLGSFPLPEIDKLLSESAKKELKNKNIFEEIDTHKHEYRQNDLGNRLLYSYLRSYLMDEVLVKVDRASMHYALETRAPFLDHRVVEFVFSLPYFLKSKFFSQKYLLKRLMRGRLPNGILNRKKKGFGVPLSRWLKEDLRGLCNELLSPEAIRRQGLFNEEYVTRLQTYHFEGRVDNHKQLWNLMVFSLWHKRWLQ